MEFFPEIRSERRATPISQNPLRNIEEAFNEMWPRAQNLSTQPFPLEVIERPDSYIVKAFLPGIEKKCVDMWFENLILTLRVEIKEDEENKESTYLLRERFYGVMARSIQLPLAEIKGNINATMKEGVLKIVVPKSHEKQTKKIEIH